MPSGRVRDAVRTGAGFCAAGVSFRPWVAKEKKDQWRSLSSLKMLWANSISSAAASVIPFDQEWCY